MIKYITNRRKCQSNIRGQTKENKLFFELINCFSRYLRRLLCQINNIDELFLYTGWIKIKFHQNIISRPALF